MIQLVYGSSSSSSPTGAPHLGAGVSRALRLALLGLAAAALALAGCGDADGEATLAGVVRTPALDVSQVELLDVSSGTGELVATTPPAGELLLVYFGYTSCPDICPTTMSDMSVAIADLSDDDAARVKVAMVTVDPERDDPEVLAGYLGHFFDSSLPLRAADEEALAAAAAAFGVRYEVEAHEPGDDRYEVSHSAVTYVVGDAGSVLVEWPFGIDSEAMASDLEILLEA